MNDQQPRSFVSDFKLFFLRGLVVLLPTVLTLWIVVKAYQFVDTTIAAPINSGIRVAIHRGASFWPLLAEQFDPTEEEVNAELAKTPAGRRPPEMPIVVNRLRAQNIDEWWAAHWYMNLIGIFVAITAVYIAGRLLGGFVGRRIYRRIEGIITTVPVFKQLYPYIKQIVDFLFSDEKRIKFNRVVVVEYPRKGIWSVGFLTGGTLKSIATASGDAVTIFIPSSPTPFTGYTITVRADEIAELPITVDEALRFVVSGGVLVPAREETSPESLASRGRPSSGLIPLPPEPRAARESDPDE